uniref:Zinc knuckle CX2CX4HX4C domain-containing protein n=1 Tax=Cannabis sativa TaxID=3483 RepID=A0A803PKH9_CANSA
MVLRRVFPTPKNPSGGTWTKLGGTIRDRGFRFRPALTTKVDAMTKERYRLNYPRVLAEISIHQKFPHTIYFENEYGTNVPVKVFYEWKLILCENYKGMGHKTADCRKKEGKQQEWVIKKEPKKPADVVVAGKRK